jgi:hypothetical protein
MATQVRDGGADAPEPSPLPDLSLYSSPELAAALISELMMRHQQDVFVLMVRRYVDGDRPAVLTKIVGDSDRVEGAVGALLRGIKRMNDQNPEPYTGELRNHGFREYGPMPGATADAEDE